MISVQADAKTKVSVGAGKVVGGTNAAAGIYANINYKRAPHQCCYHISDLQSSSMRILERQTPTIVSALILCTHVTP